MAPVERSLLERIHPDHQADLSSLVQSTLLEKQISFIPARQSDAHMTSDGAASDPSMGFTYVFRVKDKRAKHKTDSQRNDFTDPHVDQLDQFGFRTTARTLFPRDWLLRATVLQQPVLSMAIGPGFRNLGNTCFGNAVLQCLSYTSPLMRLLKSRIHGQKCRLTGFCLMCELEHFSEQCFAASRPNCVSPQRIFGQLKFIAKHLRVGRQEDSHEFMRYVVDSLQKSCLAEHQSKISDIRVQETTAIHQIFGGYLQSQVTCMQCKNVSRTFDPMLDLSVDVPQGGGSHHKSHFSQTHQQQQQNTPRLTAALTKFTATERLSGSNRYFCEKCKQNVPLAEKRMLIHRAPLVLTVHVKRFNAMGGKINRPLQFDENLNLTPFMTSGQSDPMNYKLYAVLVHSGATCHSGHYYSFVKANNNIWYSMNDSVVHQVSLSTVLKQPAYMLFYERDLSHLSTESFERSREKGSLKKEEKLLNVEERPVPRTPPNTPVKLKGSKHIQEIPKVVAPIIETKVEKESEDEKEMEVETESKVAELAKLKDETKLVKVASPVTELEAPIAEILTEGRGEWTVVPSTSKESKFSQVNDRRIAKAFGWNVSSDTEELFAPSVTKLKVKSGVTVIDWFAPMDEKKSGLEKVVALEQSRAKESQFVPPEVTRSRTVPKSRLADTWESVDISTPSTSIIDRSPHWLKRPSAYDTEYDRGRIKKTKREKDLNRKSKPVFTQNGRMNPFQKEYERQFNRNQFR